MRLAAFATLIAIAPFALRADDPYIESDGTQFMNTGYYVGPQTKIVFDYAIADWQETSDYFQSRLLDNNAGNQGGVQATVYVAGSSAASYSLGLAMGDRAKGAALGGIWTTDTNGTGTPARYCDSERRTIVIDEPNRVMSLEQDGATLWSYTIAAAPVRTDTSFPLGIFGRPSNNRASGCDYPSRIRVYGLKIYEAGELVRDFRPAKKGDAAGLYDAVGGGFYGDTRYAPGTLAAHGDVVEIEEDPYVESDGTSAINLGLGAQSNMKIELDYALTDVTDPTPDGDSHYQQRLFGEDSTASYPRISIYINNGGNIALAHADGWDGLSMGLVADKGRHQAVIDGPGNVRALCTGVTTNSVGTCPAVTKLSLRPLALFGNTLDNAGTSFSGLSQMRVYGLRIWADGSLVRDMRPRSIDGVAGLEDVVSGKFYTCDGLAASANAPTALSGRSMDGDAYIESDGSFYSLVDTRYFDNPNTKMELDFQLASVVKGAVVCGHYDDTSSFLLFCNNDHAFMPTAKDGNYSKPTMSPVLPLDVSRHVLTIDAPGKSATIASSDGTIQSSGTIPGTTKKADRSFLLFAPAKDAYGHGLTTTANGATVPSQYSLARIYRCRLWEKDETSGEYALVHDFVPLVKGGVAGFRDAVSGEFFSGDGLSAGGAVEEISDDPYVENPTGGRYFDTGYYVTKDTCVVADYMPLLQQNAQQFPFEAGDSSSDSLNTKQQMFMRTYGNGGTGQGDVSYACGASGFQSTGVPWAPHVRRQVTIDAYNRKVKVETAGLTVREVDVASSGQLPNASGSTLKLLCNYAMNANSCRARLYGVKIYEAGELVRDYVPIWQGTEYALRDDVNGTVLSKASKSSAFNGNDETMKSLDAAFFDADMREDDAWIESDGSQGINLEYYTTPRTRYEIDYQMTAIRGQNRPFGAAGSSGMDAELYIQGDVVGSGNVAFGAGDKWVAQTTGKAADLERHLAVLDLANRHFGYTGYGYGKFTSSTVVTRTSNYPMGLFAKSTAANPWESVDARNKTAMKLYAFRIYEDGALVHEYLPYRVGDVVGVYDTMTGDVKVNSISGGNAFVYGGGRGYGKFAGERKSLVVAPQDTAVRVRSSATLTAFAPGAVRYEWTRNGAVVEGEEAETLSVAWESRRHSAANDVYGVTPVFLVSGEEVYGEGATCDVSMNLLGICVILR